MIFINAHDVSKCRISGARREILKGIKVPRGSRLLTVVCSPQGARETSVFNHARLDPELHCKPIRNVNVWGRGVEIAQEKRMIDATCQVLDVHSVSVTFNFRTSTKSPRTAYFALPPLPPWVVSATVCLYCHSLTPSCSLTVGFTSSAG